MIELHDMLDNVSTRDEFAKFVDCLRADLVSRPSGWENLTLHDFLESLAAWVDDNPMLTAQPSWRSFAETLLAAKSYE